MKPEELEIANAAIASPHNARYEDIHQRIAEQTGFSIDDVTVIIKRLVTEHILHKKAGPTSNLGAGEPVSDPAKGWYEKGSQWK